MEWLLIVAAVAGLAALAVVLVQNVVDDTAEQICGSSARKTAAGLAAQSIVNDADRNGANQPSGAKTYGEWATYYTNKCNRLTITFGDAGIKATANFTHQGTSSTSTVTAADIKTPTPTGATAPLDANVAVAQCIVG